ncbi:MAG: O-acetyl-ADP-ribose deacetylase [Lentisphaerae bacterium]|jgi:O-acetyl-ADP-ribose deacetylase|nr:O-acetyl-ADP-ribose deacetylase [Lentisphaerota bacterium]MBT4821162.1 O-acetyl-ADP-ribose deacetylase [Lentisphaerota bacterium]MBT5608658.1 O-acetyl-ADP-ribose deacetylase [Lentisphaerota bacterium]MBT7058947.1 O-acetyl-ADP-ribose deacetylase [Lentisphaerota bacterium]MBT7840791.1 O-acetyl-ADP-ribose deacetylase [Lentisphaerota bacterium]
MGSLADKVTVVGGDITRQDVDAIVNAAHSDLLGGGGVDGAIHSAAGPGLLDECRKLGGCCVGEAKITGAYDLKCRYVIHTVCPIFSGGDPQELSALKHCYMNALRLASENECRTIAFPAIGCGHNAFPEDIAARIAMWAVRLFFEEHPGTGVQEVRFVCRPEDYLERVFADAWGSVFSQTSVGRI